MNRLKQIQNQGQSIWYDNIQRSLLENGEMLRMITRGAIQGVTSNPSIFLNAISKSNDYDASIQPMAWAGCKAEEIFTQLSIDDIQTAADLFRPLYNQTGGKDGFVSLEVNPYLANDTQGTVLEAQRLWKLVDRPNLMVKIPATKAGIDAIRQSIAAGLNINVTLIFSLERYAEVIEAFLSGLEERRAAQLPVEGISSVASFFVSRVDTKADKHLENLITRDSSHAEEARNLLGKAAIANAQLAYALFLEKFGSGRFAALKAADANVQRPLWASTSTKNPAYRDVIYVEELIGPDTVNTMPPKTLAAFEEHGHAEIKLTADVEQARRVFEALETLGISMQQITLELEQEGVKSFSDAYTELLDAIEKRRLTAVRELGQYQSILPAALMRMNDERIMERIFSKDSTLWTKDPVGQAEIKQRLGWLTAPITSLQAAQVYKDLAADCRSSGLERVLLLGMGGSSLAPEVLSLVFGSETNNEHNGAVFSILDSTDPAQVALTNEAFPVESTLFVVASKSGTTSEIQAYFNYFWEKAYSTLGDQAGLHFVAITDPGTKLESLARDRGFRAVLAGDPTVGGRYSALTAFGMFPAALLGIDLEKFLKQASEMMNQCLPSESSWRNPGLILGALLGEAAVNGQDKLTILADSQLLSVGSWLEQLIAESTGKLGRGIVPVDIEPEINAEEYSNDRIFVYLRTAGEKDELVSRLLDAGHTALTFNLAGPYALGAEFYRWEIATAVAGTILGVNPFDQPDVQDNKTRTAEKITRYQVTGSLDQEMPIWKGSGVEVYGKRWNGLESTPTIKAVMSSFLSQVTPNDYVAVNAYLPRRPLELNQLQELRKKILETTRAATTLGFGPRFLHSTGQLHKGGPDSGVFIQITVEPTTDIEIPTEGITFGTLEKAQALGDLETLLSRGRRAIRVHLIGGKLEDIF